MVCDAWSLVVSGSFYSAVVCLYSSVTGMTGADGGLWFYPLLSVFTIISVYMRTNNEAMSVVLVLLAWGITKAVSPLEFYKPVFLVLCLLMSLIKASCTPKVFFLTYYNTIGRCNTIPAINFLIEYNSPEAVLIPI